MEIVRETQRQTVEQSVTVRFDFPLHFTRDVFHPENNLLAHVFRRLERDRRHRAVVFVDAGVVAAFPDLVGRVHAWFGMRERELELAGPPCLVPGGEAAKNDVHLVFDVVRAAMEKRLCRHSFAVAIGGGAALDLVGLGTALFHRGLRLIRIPTTVLAQNDAGVGVKNGVNLGGAKNAVGTFSPPFAVIDDFDFLRALPEVDWIGGVAEAFKVSIIKDREFFHFLCESATRLRCRDEEAMEETVRRCALLHLQHIREGGDPFEMGRARPLDFGHWSAHRLETLSEHRIRHGQAVAAGIAIDSFYANFQGWLSDGELEAVLTGLEACRFPLWYPEFNLRDEKGRLKIFGGLDDFREHLGGELTVTFPRGLGERREINTIDLEVMERALEAVRSRAKHG